MANVLAFLAWFLVGLFGGVLPGVFLIAEDRWPVGVLVIVLGFFVGGVAAEGIVRSLERRKL